jgi:hypothetical protein
MTQRRTHVVRAAVLVLLDAAWLPWRGTTTSRGAMCYVHSTGNGAGNRWGAPGQVRGAKQSLKQINEWSRQEDPGLRPGPGKHR